MGGDEATQVKHLAEVGRSRSGLFGFCRPRKTVSPVIQQGFHDLTSHAKCRTISCGGTADDGQQACPQPDSDSAWSTLPEHLIEAIMQMLQAPPAVHHNNRAAIQVHRFLTASAVSEAKQKALVTSLSQLRTFLHCRRSLQPLQSPRAGGRSDDAPFSAVCGINLELSSILFSCLAWYASSHLSHMCNKQHAHATCG